MSIDDEITLNDEETYDYACPDCTFRSLRHPTKKSATERRAAHRAEHEGEDPVELAQPLSNE